jgi:hypothetical protein
LVRRLAQIVLESAVQGFLFLLLSPLENLFPSAEVDIGQHFLDITIGKGIAKVPTDGTENDLGGEVPPFEACGSL